MKYPQLQFLDDWTDKWVLVGSRVTCVPPPVGTDQDVLVLIPSLKEYVDFTDYLDLGGWEAESEKYDLDGNFESFRKELDCDEFNLITTSSNTFFERFLKATWECKKANAQTKQERIAIFEPIMKPPKPIGGSFKELSSWVSSFGLAGAKLEGSATNSTIAAHAGPLYYDDVLPLTGTSQW